MGTQLKALISTWSAWNSRDKALLLTWVALFGLFAFLVWPKGQAPRSQFELETTYVLVIESSGLLQADNSSSFVLWNSVTQQTFTSQDNLDGTFSVLPTQADAGQWRIMSADEHGVSVLSSIPATLYRSWSSALILTVTFLFAGVICSFLVLVIYSIPSKV